METEHPPTPQNAGSAASPAVSGASAKAGHEVTDISGRWLTVFAIGLVIFVAGTFVAMALIFRIFGKVDAHLDQQIAQSEPAVASQVHARPDYAGPELQVTPEKDLMAMNNGNALVLANYGWIDRDKGIVRLPIDRAMALIVERGIPSTAPGHTVEEFQQQRAQPQVYGQVLHP